MSDTVFGVTESLVTVGQEKDPSAPISVAADINSISSITWAPAKDIRDAMGADPSQIVLKRSVLK